VKLGRKFASEAELLLNALSTTEVKLWGGDAPKFEALSLLMALSTAQQKVVASPMK